MAPRGLTFTGLFASVMVALKLKENMDNYSKVATEEDGRVALSAPPSYPVNYQDAEGQNSEGIRLLDTEIGVPRPTRRKTGCCVCCGMDCTLFWKALGIVIAILAVWNAVKLILWAVTPTPTGLEHMPVFSTSLGCVDAEYIYSAQPTTFQVPMGLNNDHGMDVRGGCVGTILLLEGAPTSTKIKYDLTLRASDKKLLDEVILEHAPDQDGAIKDSHMLLVTAHPTANACIRYDMRIFVPPTLKKLRVGAHALTHVQFDPNSFIHLEDFFVTLYTPHSTNMIIPHNNIRANNMALEVFQGWIVGDVALDGATKVTTQRGAGIMNIRVHPASAEDPATPEAVSLRTTSGSGRSDIFYVDHEHVHRPMSNVHMSSMNADMYLTYKDANYRGRLELSSKSYTATNLQRFDSDDTEDKKWTHWYGDQQGKDEISIKSRGWVGVYF
ncbi:hypothetical protein MIND_00326000 [Mycena indigotica]|uniref:Uncharacterized protein n=1 Tax=Mycena indigotica TaxID=2126181 RepID=A0A8H6T3F6_9AGAR|nr:uncharacterized protein MIND_00326000 [Mycena indigotica]KAF7309551.1 hypothetical protein MIND_00326000 [Mycena indigotica]